MQHILKDALEKIYKEANDKFIDIKTKNKIAVKKVKTKNVEKEMMIAYKRIKVNF